MAPTLTLILAALEPARSVMARGAMNTPKIVDLDPVFALSCGAD
jgi:hypothetical protein